MAFFRLWISDNTTTFNIIETTKIIVFNNESLYNLLDDGFVNKEKPQKEWVNKMSVRCGKGKKWDPPSVPECKDKRECQEPPLRNQRIWGSFEDSHTKKLSIGSTYWYTCRNG